MTWLNVVGFYRGDVLERCCLPAVARGAVPLPWLHLLGLSVLFFLVVLLDVWAWSVRRRLLRRRGMFNTRNKNASSPSFTRPFLFD